MILRKLFSQYMGLSKSIYVIFIAKLITNMGAFIWPLMTLIMSGKMNISEKYIGIISALTVLLFLPASYLGGKLADRFNKKKIIIVLDSLCVTLFMACSFLEPGFPMLILYTFAGVIARMEYPAFSALFIEASKSTERDKVYSLSYLGNNLGLVFGAALGGFLYKDHLNLAFALDGMTTLFSTLLIIIFVKPLDINDLKSHEINEYESEEQHHESTGRILLKRKSVLSSIFIFFIGAFVIEQWAFSLPLTLEDIFKDQGAKIYGMLVSFNGLIVIAFTPLLTSLLSKLKELSKIFWGLALYGFSFLLIIGTSEKYVFFIMIFIFTIGEIIETLGAYPFTSRRIPASHRGRISSYVGIASMLGAMLSRLVAGFINEYFTYDLTFMIIGACTLMGLFLIKITYKMDKACFPNLYKDNQHVKNIMLKK